MCDLPRKRIPVASMRAVRSTCKLASRTSMCDLPADLVGKEILTRVPITSLRAVRSTCKLMDDLTKEWILGKAVAARQQQFLGFMTKKDKVCSVRFHLCRRNNKNKEDEDEEDLLDLSVMQVDLLDQFKISRGFHCDGLLLCLVEEPMRLRLVMWNPYLGQTQWITSTKNCHIAMTFALGYDINRNHKILMFLDSLTEYDIYEFSSNSWRVLKVNTNSIDSYPGGVSLKGKTYFYASKVLETHKDEYFLICFDFTTERFGPRLPLPFHSKFGDTVTLSCVREEKLAVLYQEECYGEEKLAVLYQEECYGVRCCDIVQIWVTTTIKPHYVSWSQFLRVEMKPFELTGIRFSMDGGSFFVDEEEKVVVVFDIDRYETKETDTVHHTAFVIGEGGYFKSVCLGVAESMRYCPIFFCPPLVCSSSYLPSLVQLNQQHKG